MVKLKSKFCKSSLKGKIENEPLEKIPKIGRLFSNA